MAKVNFVENVETAIFWGKRWFSAAVVDKSSEKSSVFHKSCGKSCGITGESWRKSCLRPLAARCWKEMLKGVTTLEKFACNGG